MHRSTSLLLPLVVCTALAACSKPAVSDQDRPPATQTASPAAEPQATELRDAIKTPIDKAKAAEDVTIDAAQRKQDAIEEATQ